MRIGLIADTHDHFEPRLRSVFAGVDYILHAGDIGETGVLRQLEGIAPVTAVLGNNDFHQTLRPLEVVVLGNRKFLLHHIVHPNALSEPLQRRLAIETPDVVVYGHSHRPFCGAVGRTLFINPGYAGRSRFAQPRSVAILDCDHGELKPQFIEF
jgi:putative phosphoesterase